MINDLNNTNSQTHQQQKPTVTPNTNTSGENLTRSFFGGRMSNAPIQRNIGAECLNKLKKALDEIYIGLEYFIGNFSYLYGVRRTVAHALVTAYTFLGIEYKFSAEPRRDVERLLVKRILGRCRFFE